MQDDLGSPQETSGANVSASGSWMGEMKASRGIKQEIFKANEIPPGCEPLSVSWQETLPASRDRFWEAPLWFPVGIFSMVGVWNWFLSINHIHTCRRKTFNQKLQTRLVLGNLDCQINLRNNYFPKIYLCIKKKKREREIWTDLDCSWHLFKAT